MPDWAIVLLAAFGGGLAGAVLQPVVSHFLERARSGEGIRKRREQSLRRMVTKRFEFGAGLITAILGVGLRGGMSQDEKLEFVKPIPGFMDTLAWEPERIDDVDFRETVTEYYKATSDLRQLFWSAEPLDVAAADELIKQLVELRPRITRRMDELNWPEVED